MCYTAPFSAGHRIDIERKHRCYSYHDIKISVIVLVFCGRAADSAHHVHSFQFLREDWGEFQSGMYVESRRKHCKIRCYGISMEMKQLGQNVIKMKLKCYESGLAQHPLTKASVRKFYSANATSVPFQHFRLISARKFHERFSAQCKNRESP